MPTTVDLSPAQPTASTREDARPGGKGNAHNTKVLQCDYPARHRTDELTGLRHWGLVEPVQPGHRLEEAADGHVPVGGARAADGDLLNHSLPPTTVQHYGYMPTTAGTAHNGLLVTNVHTHLNRPTAMGDDRHHAHTAVPQAPAGGMWPPTTDTREQDSTVPHFHCDSWQRSGRPAIGTAPGLHQSPQMATTVNHSSLPESKAVRQHLVMAPLGRSPTAGGMWPPTTDQGSYQQPLPHQKAPPGARNLGHS